MVIMRTVKERKNKTRTKEENEGGKNLQEEES